MKLYSKKSINGDAKTIFFSKMYVVFLLLLMWICQQLKIVPVPHENKSPVVCKWRGCVCAR